MSSSEITPSYSNDQVSWRSFQKDNSAEELVAFSFTSTDRVQSDTSWRDFQQEQVEHSNEDQSWRTQQLKPDEQKAREEQGRTRNWGERKR